MANLEQCKGRGMQEVQMQPRDSSESGAKSQELPDLAGETMEKPKPEAVPMEEQQSRNTDIMRALED